MLSAGHLSISSKGLFYHQVVYRGAAFLREDYRLAQEDLAVIAVSIPGDTYKCVRMSVEKIQPLACTERTEVIVMVLQHRDKIIYVTVLHIFRYSLLNCGLQVTSETVGLGVVNLRTVGSVVICPAS